MTIPLSFFLDELVSDRLHCQCLYHTKNYCIMMDIGSNYKVEHKNFVSAELELHHQLSSDSYLYTKSHKKDLLMKYGKSKTAHKRKFKTYLQRKLKL